MKLVINKCYGGFSLSAKASKRLAELQGRQCFFYSGHLDPQRVPDEEADGLFISAFDVPEYPKHEDWDKHCLDPRPDDRANPLLIQVVEEFGTEVASGPLAQLAFIEIPDGVAWELDNYFGIESVHEVHRSWG
jgi:hypothetical protein